MTADQPIRVVSADDHQIVRHGIKPCLPAAGMLMVVAFGGGRNGV